MKHYRKTFLGSIAAFVLGTSCCWMSSLALWFGGATLVGIIGHYIENIQILLLVVGLGFGILSLFLYLKRKKS